jgi:hypothetical protein
MDSENMTYEKALELINGDEAAANTAALKNMCVCAEDELRGRMRQGVSAEEIGERFYIACAMLALAMYIQLEAGAEKHGTVKLGKMSVSQKGSGAVRQSAAALRRQAEAMLALELDDEEFFFEGVRG